jgi:predicted GNAT superfamily acetyltransferase
VRIRELDDVAAMHDAADLFDRIWRVGAADHVLASNTLRALAHAGNYVAGAHDGETLVGASAGFFAADGHLHSHVTGVAPEYQGHGVGRALKLHQREWALARGRSTISWTFDPLMARNAYFNLHTLGATAVEYLPDFYGAMADGVNAGDATDRIYVVWQLDGPVPPVPPEHDVPALLARDGDAPVLDPQRGPALTVATPLDIERLRATDDKLAIRWRMAMREAMTSALASGYRIAGISRDGHYLLEAQ